MSSTASRLGARRCCLSAQTRPERIIQAESGGPTTSRNARPAIRAANVPCVSRRGLIFRQAGADLPQSPYLLRLPPRLCAADVRRPCYDPNVSGNDEERV